jgi:hypothetical protein
MVEGGAPAVQEKGKVMISYLILHYNRVFLLDTTVKLIRKFFPAETQILIADDGSTEDAIKFIKTMPIDHLEVRRDKSHAAGAPIRNCQKHVRHGYYLFSEDDFWFSPVPVVGARKGLGNFRAGEVFPELKLWGLGNSSVPVDATVALNRKGVKMAQLARMPDPKILGNKLADTANNWQIVCREKVRTQRSFGTDLYYNNWPFMIKSRFLSAVRPEGTWPISRIERFIPDQVDKAFGGDDWIAALCPPHYIHVGYPFSQQPGIRTKRAMMRDLLAKSVPDITPKQVAHFSEYLQSLYISGKFVLDFDELAESGLNTFFVNSLKRIKN